MLVELDIPDFNLVASFGTVSVLHEISPRATLQIPDHFMDCPALAILADICRGSKLPS